MLLIHRGLLCPEEVYFLRWHAEQYKGGMRDVPPTVATPVLQWVGPRQLWGCYLLSYGEGDKRAPHVDKADGGREHTRLVCMVQPADKGGHLIISGVPVELEAGDAVEFRADVCEHEVTPVVRGSRVVLTCGVAVQSNIAR